MLYLRQGSIRTRFPGILQHNNQKQSVKVGSLSLCF